MAKPQVEIEVDEATGRWTVDGLPMILIPQHFFVNNHVAIENALGADEFGRVLAPAGYKSAYFWCEREAEYHKLAGVDVFLHYMRRLSQRGWAQFKVLSCDEQTGRASVRVDHSLLVTGTPPGPEPQALLHVRPVAAGLVRIRDDEQRPAHQARGARGLLRRRGPARSLPVRRRA